MACHEGVDGLRRECLVVVQYPAPHLVTPSGQHVRCQSLMRKVALWIRQLLRGMAVGVYPLLPCSLDHCGVVGWRLLQQADTVYGGRPKTVLWEGDCRGKTE